MQTFTFSLNCSPRWVSSRNPLVRASDRIQVAAMLLVFAIALLSAPLAGAAGTVIHDSLSHRVAQDRVSRHQFVATATQDSTMMPQAYEKPFLTPIQWEFANTVHVGELRTSDSVKAGDKHTIWIDSAGNRSSEPLSDGDAAAEAVIAAVGLWFATIGIASAGWALLRWRLNQRRHADWDREFKELADNGGRMNRNT